MSEAGAPPGYSDTDQMIVSAARMVLDDDVCYVGVGLPMLVCLLAKHLHAPNLTVMTENGVVRRGIFPLPRATDSLGMQTGADLISGLFYVSCLGQAGYVTLGFLGAGQIDRFGNVNDTATGDYRNPTHRWPGSGGGNDVVSCCARTVYILRQSRRRFPEKVDFITCPGYLDGRPGRREEVGLRPGTGPAAVITNLGVYGFQEGEMVLQSYHADAGVTLEQVQAEVGWPIRLAEDLHPTPPPTAEELRVLRQEVDPLQYWVGGRRNLAATEEM